MEPGQAEGGFRSKVRNTFINAAWLGLAGGREASWVNQKFVQMHWIRPRLADSRARPSFSKRQGKASDIFLPGEKGLLFPVRFGGGSRLFLFPPQIAENYRGFHF